MENDDRMTVHEVPTDDLSKISRLFEQAFNAGDQVTIERMYSPDAISVWKPGELPLSGDARRANVAEFLALGLPIKVTPRSTYVNDDIALMIVDWEISGVSASGEQVQMAGTGTDVLRRARDGRWRYVIDNAYGGSTH